MHSYAQLTINEFSSKKGHLDEDLTSTDWIEIINISDSVVQLSDYYLSDDLLELDKWQFPNENIDPMEIILVCASDKNRLYRTRHWSSIILADNNWKYFIGTEEPTPSWKDLNFDAQWSEGSGGFGYGDNDDNTIVDFPDGTVSIYIRKEFDIENLDLITQLILHADYDDAFVAYINGMEIVRSPNILGDPPAYNATAEWDHEASLYWGGEPENFNFTKDELSDILIQGNNVLAIQIHNQSSISSDMTSNFFLSAGINSDDDIYQNTPTWFDSDTLTSSYHTNFKLSSDEHVIISNLAGTIIDSMIVSNDLMEGLSRGRSPDGIGGWCYFNTPTPNLPNGNSSCYMGVTPDPELLPSGWYDVGDSSLMVSLQNDPSNSFYYTTNGDVPNNNDQIYTGPLFFNQTTVLSVKSLGDENWLPSKSIDRTYIINEDNHNLPVFSVFTDSINLWDNEQGLYVFGSSAAWDYPFYGSNFWQPWSRRSRLEYFSSDQIKQAEEDFDLEIHGGWSRAEPQKSFRFDFKSEYTGKLNWPVIPEKDFIEDFNNINLRNGGQHTYSDKIQDAIISRVAQQTHVDNMAYQPCILYLNGSYWGIYGIREKIDEHYIEDNFGYDDSEVDLLNSWTTLAGSDAHFVEAQNQILTMDVDDPDYYNFVNSKFDLDNFKDYFIVQTYIQNTDWMGIWWGLNNVKLWRPQTDDGRWRYVLYDTDAAFGYFGTILSDNYINWARNTDNPHSNIFNNLLNNNQFECEFINRYADLINTIFDANYVVDIASDIQSEVSMGMIDHIDRWSLDSYDPSYWYGNNYSLDFDGVNVPYVPTIGSMENWNSSVESVLYYNSQRIDWARQNIIDEFGLDGQYDVSLDVYPESSGTISISTITPNEYPWEGVYFNSCPMMIQANPSPGYMFDFWEIVDSDSVSSYESAFEISITEDISLVAHFSECNYNDNEEECVILPCEIGTVYISEVHNLGDPEDFIEIYNSGTTDCSLNNFLIDDEQPFDDYIFGDTIIAAGSYWVGYEDDVNSFSSGISANGETIYFGDILGNISSLIIEELQMNSDSILLSQIFDSNGVGCYAIESPGFENNDCLVEGCVDLNAINYNQSANYDDGSCEYIEVVLGCVSIDACNYNMLATDDDGSCHYDCIGCTDLQACNYEEDNTVENGSCQYPNIGYDCSGDCLVDSDGDGVCDVYEVEGCTDLISCNFNSSATEDDNSCIYPDELYFDCNNNCINDIDGDGVCDEIEINGCTDFLYQEYNPLATDDDGSCLILSLYGCMELEACNFNPLATDDDGSCYNNDVGCGCDQPAPNLGYDCDGNCISDIDSDNICDEFEINGCMDLEACNFDQLATDNDNSCIYPIEIFLDCNGNCLVDSDGDGVCDELEIIGCVDELACNYNSQATDLGECNYAFYPYDCAGFCINDMDGDGICDELEIVGCVDELACNYNSQATDLGECTYPGILYNCAGFCINDIDGDGVCDELELEGCTVIYACNYNPLATDNDGSCEFVSCSGCLDIDACNYCETCVLEDNITCVYPMMYLDCDGNCLADADGDGVCDELEVSGCQDEAACNYNISSTDPCFGSPNWSWWSPYYCCDYPGSIDGEIYLDCDNNCLSDIDGDGVCDQIDNCPNIYNPNQEDLNWNSIGDDCEGIYLHENSIYISDKSSIKIIDILGREINSHNGIRLIIYDDGTVEKEFRFD